MISYNYGEYETDPLWFSELNISEIVRFKLISAIEELYHHTDQDSEDFSFEFYVVVRDLLKGRLAINTKYLLISDCFEDFVSILPPEEWNAYLYDYKRILTEIF